MPDPLLRCCPFGMCPYNALTFTNHHLEPWVFRDFWALPVCQPEGPEDQCHWRVFYAEVRVKGHDRSEPFEGIAAFVMSRVCISQ